MRYTHVIWDWNGTLLDDVPWCIGVIDTMLKKRGMPILGGVAAYHNVFCFPVIDYYRRIGFDFAREPFEALAAEYVELYYSDGGRLCLFSDADETLAAIRDTGLHQVILSASEQGNLMKQLKPFGIGHYFDEIIGISDIYAGGKIDAGRAYLCRAGIGKAVLIGDTTHDLEVAGALGVDCILVSRGHQSEKALRAGGATVVNGLKEALEAMGC